MSRVFCFGALIMFDCFVMERW